MTPPALAEKLEPAVELLDYLRESLSEKERDRFDLELFETTRHGSKDELRQTLSAWMLTVLIRNHPSYEQQRQGFLEVLRSGDPFGDAKPASA